MRTKRKLTSVFACLVLLAVGMLLPVGADAAFSGEITRAEATGDWTLADITGAVEWTGCERWVSRGPGWESPYEEEESGDHPAPYCGWLPYATLGPGSQPSDCESSERKLWHLGEKVTLVWKGVEGIGYQKYFLDSANFNRSDVPLSGYVERLVCLSIIETAPEYVICAAVLGLPCPPFGFLKTRHEVASALLTTVEPEESEGGHGGDEEPESQAGPGEGPSSGKPTKADESPSMGPEAGVPPPVARKRHRHCARGKHLQTARKGTHCRRRHGRHSHS